MEHRARRAGTVRSRPSGDEDDSDLVVDKAVEDGGPQQPAARNDAGSTSAEVVYFKDHNGARYIWPYELCRSYEGVEPLLEQVYDLRQNQSSRQLVLNRDFVIQNDDGDTILPSLWDAIVRPYSTIKIRFDSGFTDGSGKPFEGSEHGSHENEEDVDLQALDIEPFPAVRFDDSTRRPRSPGLYSSTSESDELDETSDSDGDMPPDGDDVKSREVTVPVDAEGSRLSFNVKTKILKTANGKHTSSLSDTKQDLVINQVETQRITRAMAIGIEDRTVLQVHILPGPENTQLRGSVSITWHHVCADRLDFNRFSNACLTIPGLSDRLQTLTRKMLDKLRSEEIIKPFLDGMFIEPGTVLRADESDQPDPQSVIFSCIPYLDLQPAASKSSTTSLDSFPMRTLMQSYYPYESVRERDEEQAYCKFGKDRLGNIIHMPNFWIMNIGPNLVVTCGHKPLSAEMTKSITVVEEDLKLLGTQNLTSSTLTKIRLTDCNGHVLIFPLNACLSYFQMEQKVRELRDIDRVRPLGKKILFQQRTPDGLKDVVAENWKVIIKRTDLVFIDLLLLDGKDAPAAQKPTANTSSDLQIVNGSTSTPPFFHWPRNTNKIAKSENTSAMAPNSDQSGPASFLEHVEYFMSSQTLDEYETFNAVDKTFTSTTYYQSLDEHEYGQVCTEFISLTEYTTRPAQSLPGSSHHRAIVEAQCINIAEQAAVFFKFAHATLSLFVDDVNKSSVLRKIWRVMANVHQHVLTIQQREVGKTETGESWFIRNTAGNRLLPTLLPQHGDEKFKRSVKRCRRCRSTRSYNSFEEALEHLRRHARSAAGSEQKGISPDSRQQVHSPLSDAQLRTWLLSSSERSCEETNEGSLRILTFACEIVQDLYTQGRELSQGVGNEDGNMSDLYSFPPRLIEAFRNICVFYMAIERALHYTEEIYKESGFFPDGRFPQECPYSEDGIDVLKRFGESAQRSLLGSRIALCSMARSEPPLDVFMHMSLGPEYVCSWLMRRLLVKPLVGRNSAGDFYREYLSTIQFEVNHHPSKRLLRDINLLREELQVLMRINTWQTHLVQNYLGVLDDSTYEKEMPSREVLFSYERILLNTCLDHLDLAQNEYAELRGRCGPLSDRTKQSLEINEEDHGKAIMIFTIVTVIFLPLSFVTSYLGMNTADIRDMDNRQSLFWTIAIPLTVVTVGASLIIGYNGDQMRDAVTTVYHTATGKHDRGASARESSVGQRKRHWKAQSASNSTLGSTNIPDEAEYADVRLNVTYSMPPPEIEHDISARKFLAHDLPTKKSLRVSTHRYEPAYGDYDEYDARPTPYPFIRETYRDDRPTRNSDKILLHRRITPPPPPPPRPPPRASQRRVYYDASDDDSAAGARAYTWHKKRKGNTRHARRSDRNRSREESRSDITDNV